jgi:hypothetical protein
MDLFDFWFADEWTVDETHWILSTSLEPILNGWLDLESLINLRKSYRRLIADTGIAISEINKQAKTFNTSLKIC